MCIIEDITGKQDNEDMITLSNDEHAIIIYLQETFHCRYKHNDGTHMCVMTEKYAPDQTNSTVFAFRRDQKKEGKYILNVKSVSVDRGETDSRNILARTGIDKSELLQAINTLFQR